MSLPRLCSRLAKIEAQWRPAHVAAVLARVRQCPPADRQACLLDALTTVDRATAEATMLQLTDAEFDALVGPELARLIDTLSEAELDALARGDPAVTRQVQRALRSGHNQGDVSR